MRFWARGKVLPQRRRDRVLQSLILSMAVACSTLSAQTPKAPTTKKAVVQRANELTLAGLRPGKDNSIRAVQLYKQADLKTLKEDSQLHWSDACRKQTLSMDLDSEMKVQVIRVAEADWLQGDCLRVPPGPWKTGRGLRVQDEAKRVTQLYGQPDSRSPSSKGGKTLELLYYAFDWAGSDVPQVMEVLCTKDSAVQPGRVLEITLAAPSL
jgi:hypothetical protein